MSEHVSHGEHEPQVSDVSPGDEGTKAGGVGSAVLGYLVGLGLAILLTATLPVRSNGVDCIEGLRHPLRHCERSEAIQRHRARLDCFVARAPRNDGAGVLPRRFKNQINPPASVTRRRW